MKLPIWWIALVLALLLVKASQATNTALLEQDSKAISEEDSPIQYIGGLPISITRQSKAKTKSKASIRQLFDRCNDSDSRTGSSFRMKECSIAQRVEVLSGNNADLQTSFESLVRQIEEEEQRQQASIAATPRVSSLAGTILRSSLLFAVGAFLWDPQSAKSMFQSTLSSKIKTILAVAWIPWCWYHPSRFALVDLLVLIQFVRQPYVYSYLQTEILPVFWKTIKSILLAELWTQAWHWIFWHLEQAQQQLASQRSAATSQGNGTETNSWKDGHLVWSTPEPPEWLSNIHSKLVGAIRRRVKITLKKSIQEIVTSAIGIWKTMLKEWIFLAVG